jgi:hypothetical protein
MDADSSVKRTGQTRDLGQIRQGWDEIEQMEVRLLRQMTVQESLRQYLALQRAFEPQLRATEHLFRAERLAHLRNLQRRLLSLNALDDCAES